MKYYKLIVPLVDSTKFPNCSIVRLWLNRNSRSLSEKFEKKIKTLYNHAISKS